MSYSLSYKIQMKNLSLLYFDELKGYYKSKVMIILWIGLPILVLLFRLLIFLAPEALNMPSTFPIPISSLVGFIISSIGGALSAVMLAALAFA